METPSPDHKFVGTDRRLLPRSLKQQDSRKNMKPTRVGMLISALPSLFMLGLFYSLAIHMRIALGGWPKSIGNNGFPDALDFQAGLAGTLCLSMFWLSLFTVAPAILVCLIVAPWRRLAVYFGLHAVFFSLCWGLMLLAPSPFLYWWWD